MDVKAFLRVLNIARDLNPTGEYLRAQVELICGIFYLPTDDYRHEIEGLIKQRR